MVVRQREWRSDLTTTDPRYAMKLRTLDDENLRDIDQAQLMGMQPARPKPRGRRDLDSSTY